MESFVRVRSYDHNRPPRMWKQEQKKVTSSRTSLLPYKGPCCRPRLLLMLDEWVRAAGDTPNCLLREGSEVCLMRDGFVRDVLTRAERGRCLLGRVFCPASWWRILFLLRKCEQNGPSLRGGPTTSRRPRTSLSGPVQASVSIRWHSLFKKRRGGFSSLCPLWRRRGSHCARPRIPSLAVLWAASFVIHSISSQSRERRAVRASSRLFVVRHG